VQCDAKIVRAVLKGDRPGFAELVKRYQRSVRAVCLGVLADEHLADDAAQEAFVKAYEKLQNLRKAELFGPWLLKIAKRCALDTLRQKPREQALENDAALPAVSSNGELDEAKLKLLRAVMQLPKSEKQVVMLRYFSRHSVKDVALIANRSVGTVTKQLSRAHSRLRKMCL